MAQVDIGKIKIVWKGAWNSSTAYTVDDAVSHSGSSYICIQAGTNQNPSSATAYWQVMANAGTNGTNGTDLTSTLGTQGQIVYRDGSGLAALNPGTSGHVLTTGGSGANPSWAAAVGGKIGQVIYNQKTDVSTVSGSSSAPNYTAMLTATITPSATSSKVLIFARLHTGSDGGNHTYVQVRRGTTPLTLGDAAGSRTTTHSSVGYDSTWFGGDQVINMLDTPNTTAATTYNVVLGTEGNSYCNRSNRDSNAISDHRATSDLIIMEVLA